MKISNDVLKMINRLPDEKRVKVDKVVRRHVAACLRNGFPPENMDRVFIEAVEVVDLENVLPDTDFRGVHDWEPYRHYDQYISPKAA